MIYLPWLLMILFLITTVILSYYVYRFAKMILEIQDTVSESLQVIDGRIVSINKILEIPLYFDSPEIRRVHDDLRITRDAIIKIAETFSTIESEDASEE